MKQLNHTATVSRNFQVLTFNNEAKYIICLNNGLKIEIKKDGYIPKLGLHLIDYLFETNYYGINAIEIGTGETGIIAQNIFLTNRFTNVWAVDIDKEAIVHAQTSSIIANHINWRHNDCFKDFKKEKFDLIVSNPPQMPVHKNISLHDDGGKDGLDLIEKIVSDGIKFLSDKGAIILICFDFLIDSAKFTELANKNNLYFSIKRTIIREIREDGRTFQNLKWIKRMYPKFEICYDIRNKPFHYVKIVELCKK